MPSLDSLSTGEDQKSPSMATQAMKTPTSEQRLKIRCMTKTCSPQTSWPTRQSSRSALCARPYSTEPAAVSGGTAAPERTVRLLSSCSSLVNAGSKRGSQDHPEWFRLPRGASLPKAGPKPASLSLGLQCSLPLGAGPLGDQRQSKYPCDNSRHVKGNVSLRPFTV